MKINVKKTIVVSIVFLLVLLGTVQIFAINMRYPSPIDTPTRIGETTSYFGMEMTCTGKSIDSIKNTCAKYGMDIPPEYYKYGMSLEDLNICNISITFQNNSSETRSTYPYFFHLVSGVWENTIGPELYRGFNNTDQLKIELEPGEKKTIVLPIQMERMFFFEKEWDSIESQEFQLLFTVYPFKRYFLV